MTGSNKDNSLLFSLDALLKHEGERVDDERARAEAQRAAELEQKRRQLQAAEQQKAAERERALVAARELEEESHRFEAMKLAEIERARVEAEARARLELELSRQQHERKLAELKRATARSVDRMAMLASFALLALSLVGGAVLYLVELRPSMEQARETYQRSLATQEQKSAEHQRQLELANKRESQLVSRVAELERQSKSFAPANADKPKKNVGPTVRPPTGRGPREAVVCKNDGDPIDGCLPRK